MLFLSVRPVIAMSFHAILFVNSITAWVILNKLHHKKVVGMWSVSGRYVVGMWSVVRWLVSGQ